MAHPHYSPDLISSDSHFSELYKKNVGGKWFVAEGNMKQAVIFNLQWTLIYIR